MLRGRCEQEESRALQPTSVAAHSGDRTKAWEKAVTFVSGQCIWKRETWLKSHSMKVNFRIYFKISHFEDKVPSPRGKTN